MVIVRHLFNGDASLSIACVIWEAVPSLLENNLRVVITEHVVNI